MLRSALMAWMGDCPRLLPCLYRIEQLSRNNGKIGNFDGLPLALGIWTRDTLASIKVFDHSDPVPNQAAGIQFILKQPRTSLHIAIDS